MIENPANGAVLFSKEELQSKDGTIKLADGFADRLRDLRLSFGRGMKVNSCCRTPEHNEAVGGSKGSYHLTEGNASNGTCAIDISARDSVYRRSLVAKALELGWTVGVYKTFVHLDDRGRYGQTPILFHG